MSETKIDPLSMSLDQIMTASGSKHKRNNSRNRPNRRQKRKSGSQVSSSAQPTQVKRQKSGRGNIATGVYTIPAKRLNQTTAIKKPVAADMIPTQRLKAKATKLAVPLKPIPQASALPGFTTGVTVRVKNLNLDIIEEDLQELFSFYGEVKSVKLFNGKGMANVRYRRRTEAETAVQKLNGRELDGTPMEVSIPYSLTAQKKAATGVQPSNGTKLFVGSVKAKQLIGNNRAKKGQNKRNVAKNKKKGFVDRIRAAGAKPVTAEALDADLQSYMQSGNAVVATVNK